MAELKKKPAFYLMSLCTMLSCGCTYIIISNLVPILRDRGLSTTEATGIHAIYMLAVTGTKLLVGFLCDRIGAKPTTLLCVGCCLVSCLLLTVVQDYWLGLVVAILFSSSVSLTGVTVPLLAMELFGSRGQIHYIGIFMSMVSCSSIFSSPIVNSVYDGFGSYHMALLGGGVLCAVTVGLYLVLFRLAAKDRKALEASR